MKGRYFLFLFGLLAIGDLFSIYFNTDFRPFTKPLIMISLIGYFLLNGYIRIFNTIWWIFVVSLLLALGGDVFLLFDNGFLFGLISFLLMQVGYILVFAKGKNYHGKRELIYGLILIAFTTINMGFLWPHLGAMKLPVLFYTITIATMNLFAFTRDYTTRGYYAVFLGSLFFIVSDTLLGVNTFVDSVEIGGIPVMLTYILAQYLIVTGVTNSLEVKT